MRCVAILLLLPAVCLAACPSGYTEYIPGKCAKYLTSQMSFDQALSFCKSDGADLISIHSQAENDAIYSQANNGDNSWIGLQCDPQARSFTWTDKTLLDYFGFSDITCRSKTGGFVMQRNTGTWAFGTDGTYHTICGIDMGKQDSRCDDGYSFEEETATCLKVVEAVDTWTNAEASCQSEGGHLVSVHEQQTNAFVRRIANDRRLFDGIFIGLKLNDSTGAPTWTDGSAFGYQNFDVGMPNGVFGQCGAMLTKILEGQWVSVHCDSLTRLPYVCAKPASVTGSPCPSQNTFTETGDILSPGYPSSNAPGLTCEYFIAAPEGNHVLLEFSEFTLTVGDSITIYDGEADDTVIKVLDSTNFTPTDIFRTKNDNVMKLIYVSGSGNGARTWHAQYMPIF